MKIVNVPIESLADRYSLNWNQNFPREFIAAVGKENFIDVYPEISHQATVSQGQFLNVVETNKFKSLQMAMICDLFSSNQITEDTVFFFHDLWFPGLEALFYMRQGLGLNFKITGMLHAGTYDEWDFLSQCGMERWGKNQEISWLSEIDTIFLATFFHKNLLSSTGRLTKDNTVVSGFPLWLSLPSVPAKEKLVVFPHRLAKEKDPESFDKLAQVLAPKYPDWSFVKTKDVCKSKEEYYELLSRASIAVSCAHQETWGIAQQEATLSRCFPIVPNRLSYAEMYHPNSLYSSFDGLVDCVSKAIETPSWTDTVVERTINSLQSSLTHAVPSMLHTMRTLVGENS